MDYGDVCGRFNRLDCFYRTAIRLIFGRDAYIQTHDKAFVEWFNANGVRYVSEAEEWLKRWTDL